MTCASCGYRLVGLEPEAACPECARPVAESIAEWNQWTQERRRRLVVSCSSWTLAVTGMLAGLAIEAIEARGDTFRFVATSLIMVWVAGSIVSLWAAVPADIPAARDRVFVPFMSLTLGMLGADFTARVIDHARPIIPWIGPSLSMLLLLSNGSAIAGKIASCWQPALRRLAPGFERLVVPAGWTLRIAAAVVAVASPLAMSQRTLVHPGLVLSARWSVLAAVICMALGAIALTIAGIACIRSAQQHSTRAGGLGGRKRG